MYKNKKIIKNIILSSLALALTGLSRVIYNIIVGKEFNPDILGQVNLVLSVAMLLSLAISILTESSASKFLSEYLSKSDRQGIFTLLQRWLFIGSFLSILAAYIFRDQILQYIRVDENLYLIGLLIVLLMATHHFYRGCFYGLDLVNKYFKFEIISSILFFVALVASVYVYKNNLLFPFLTYYGAFSILAVISLRSYFKPTKESFSLAKDIGLYGTISAIGTLASTSSAYLAIIFTGFYLSSEQVGFYSAAVSITSILLFAPTILGRVLLPTMSSSYGVGDADTIKALLDVSTTWLSLIAFFLGGIFIILSEEILIALFTPEYADAKFSLQMLILGLCLSTIAVPSVSALSGTRYVKIPNMAGVIGLLFCLILWPFLIPKFGINGTAIGYIVGSSLISTVILFYSNKYYHINLKKILNISIICIVIFTVSIETTRFIPFYQSWFASCMFAILFFIFLKNDIYKIWCKVNTG